MNFSELGLAEPLYRATVALGYEQATPVQARAIPVVLSGADLVACAQTGTGKTAAFALPLLNRLLLSRPAGAAPSPAARPRPSGPKGAAPRPRALRALVLSPTRELAAQIGESVKNYGRFTPLRHAVVFGGVSQNPQVGALRHGVDLLVATPGRLMDLMEQGHIDLSQVEILVLDEADRMLDMGFLPALKRIVARLPQQRQTLMFSATMPADIRRLAKEWLTEPARVDVGVAATPADRIAQSVHMVDKQHKADLLLWFLQQTPRSRTLVFSRTKHGADKIVRRLQRGGLRAEAIHGNKSQMARTRTLAQFKGDQPPILVATDIAARGLDIRDVSHIINYDMPETPETYVHRIGRTARAGAAGTAVSFCAGEERALLRQIENCMNCRIAVEATVAGFEPAAVPAHRSPKSDPPRPQPQPANRHRKGRRPAADRFAGSARRALRP